MGRHTTQLNIVMTLNKLMLSMAPLIDDNPIIFLLSTFRDWNVMFDPMAAKKPAQQKLTSVMDASATPPTTGTSAFLTDSRKQKINALLDQYVARLKAKANSKNSTPMTATPTTPTTPTV